MRITGWHVDGYGHFRDRRWDGLPAGLTVVHGPNEAGKSTLLSFLESVLFGFRDGRSRQPAIPALDGGTHGGRVSVRAPDGDWAIERTRPGGLRLTGPAGAGSEADLRRLLGNVDRELYASVFAFSLTELEDLGGLADDAFGQRLFAAGLTGVGQSAHDALATLERRAAVQYKPKSASVLKDLWDELEGLRAERRAARTALEDHPALRRTELARRAARDEAEARATGLRREDRRLERLQRVWSVLSRRDGLAEQLGRLPDLVEVSPGVVDEVLALEARLAGRQQSLREVVARIASRREARDRVVVDDAALRGVPVVQVLHGEAVAHRDRRAALADLRADERTVARGLEDAMVEIGPAWTRERVLGFDASVAVRDEIDRWAAGLAAAERAVEAARTELARREEDVAEAVAARSELEPADPVGARRGGVAPASGAGDLADDGGDGGDGGGGDGGDGGGGDDDGTTGAGHGRAADGGGDPVDPALLARQLAALRSLRAGLDELGERRRDAEAAEARLRDHESAAPTAGVGAGPDGPGPALVVAGALAVVVGIGLVVAGQVAGGAAAAVLGVVVLVVARTAARHAEEQAARARDAAGRETTRTERGALLRRRHDEAVRALDAARARVARDAGAAGLGHAVPTRDAVAERARVLSDARDRGAARQAHAERIVEADDRVRRARGVAEDRAAAVAEAERGAAALDGRWAAWRTAHGLPETTSPATAARVVEAVRRARALHVEADRLRERGRASETALQAWTSRAEAVLREAGRLDGREARATAPTGDRLLAAIARLHEDAEAAVVAARDRDGLDAELTELDEDASAVRDRIADDHDRREAVLAAHGATDLEALRQAAAATIERRRLHAAIEELDGELREVAGAGTEARELVGAAGTGTVAAWSARRDEIERERRTVEADRDRAVRELTLAVRAREELEASADMARIDGRIEELRAEAAEGAVAFRTTLGAQRLIRETLAAYVEDRQPQVLVAASSWFARVTDGRYVRVRQSPAKRETLELEDAAGRVVDPVALSRGTREQLYLCLRLALATGVAAAGSPLPLIVDDVLVNFSPDRAAAVARVLVEVAAGQQVLFFTCHPATRDLLVRAAEERRAEVRVEELLRGGAVAAG